MSAKPKKQGRDRKPSFETASRQLPDAVSKREKMLTDYYEAHAAFHAAHDALAERFKAFSAMDRDLKQHQATIDRLREIVDGGPAPILPEIKEVDAPLMTDAEFLHQKELDPEAVNVGKSKVLFSMDQFIGGFSRFPNRPGHHEMAAARFLSLHERSQLGGAKANDMSQPFVDRSGQSASHVAEAGEQARRDYEAARTAIGTHQAKLLELVIVGRVSARTIAAQRRGVEAGAVGGRAVAIIAQEVWDAIDALAQHFGFSRSGERVLPGNKPGPLTRGTKTAT